MLKWLKELDRILRIAASATGRCLAKQVKWLRELDRILRGDATRMEELQKRDLSIPVLGLSGVILVLAMFYAVCMGFYSMFRPDGPMYLQGIATIVKVPALFFLTLVVTFPSLYVFNALVGSRLNLLTIFRLLIAALAVNLAVLSSLGPIVAFFAVSTESYGFMIMLNVLTFTLSGLLGFSFLLQTLNRLDITRRKYGSPASLSTASGELPLPAAKASGSIEEDKDTEEVELIKAEIAEKPGALDRVGDHVLGKHVQSVFACWVVAFGLVGAQMSWVLRPFIGSPNAPFQWFRPRGSNFFESVWHTIANLFS
jgi:hypothetical protein